MSRTINMSQKVLQMIDIQVFVDASLLGPCPVPYEVTWQPSGTNQGLIASK